MTTKTNHGKATITNVAGGQLLSNVTNLRAIFQAQQDVALTQTDPDLKLSVRKERAKNVPVKVWMKGLFQTYATSEVVNVGGWCEVFEMTNGVIRGSAGNQRQFNEFSVILPNGHVANNDEAPIEVVKDGEQAQPATFLVLLDTAQQPQQADLLFEETWPAIKLATELRLRGDFPTAFNEQGLALCAQIDEHEKAIKATLKEAAEATPERASQLYQEIATRNTEKATLEREEEALRAQKQAVMQPVVDRMVRELLTEAGYSDADRELAARLLGLQNEYHAAVKASKQAANKVVKAARKQVATPKSTTPVQPAAKGEPQYLPDSLAESLAKDFAYLLQREEQGEDVFQATSEFQTRIRNTYGRQAFGRINARANELLNAGLPPLAEADEIQPGVPLADVPDLTAQAALAEVAQVTPEVPADAEAEAAPEAETTDAAAPAETTEKPKRTRKNKET